MSVEYDFDGSSGSFRVTNPEKRLADLLRVEQAKLNRLVISGASDTQIDELQREMGQLRRLHEQAVIDLKVKQEIIDLSSSSAIDMNNELHNQDLKIKNLETERTQHAAEMLKWRREGKKWFEEQNRLQQKLLGLNEEKRQLTNQLRQLNRKLQRKNQPMSQENVNKAVDILLERRKDN